MSVNGNWPDRDTYIITPVDQMSKALLNPRFLSTVGYKTSGARYAGVPTIDFRKDFFPMILAYPKSQSFTFFSKKFRQNIFN